MSLIAIAATLKGMSASSDLMQSTMNSIQSGLSKVSGVLGKIWNKFTEAGTRAFNAVKDVWNEHLEPILGPWIEKAQTLINFFREQFNNAIEEISNAFGGLPDRMGELRDDIEKKLGGLRERIMGIPSGLVESFGELREKVSSKIAGLLERFAKFRDDARDMLGGIGDSILEPFRKLWDIVKKIKDAITGAFMSVVDKVTGYIPGGGGDSKDTGGATVTQTFNMTFDVSGVVDGNARDLAKEMGQLMVDEFNLQGGSAYTSGAGFV